MLDILTPDPFQPSTARAERPYKAFCFLPLPIETGLPVHVNGHFALDHEARRNLWSDDGGGYRTDWNTLLLNEVRELHYGSEQPDSGTSKITLSHELGSE